ncbi:cbb3-type cytochrome oxidase maturation protein [Mucilaginibacter frigoritolerans]|jgi:cbb3-type cytochrome oxidase maturation protein|uniref:Cbb3-type cytochrome oxidase maturation protein n=1 Tax=Mucilaginibacter frigoritolerans TaxID=652788 RepID=A0A562U885_9SPHI|nr:cbb3-type cytochrome oxidase assembly protein CcoS [Mucilaginibacter frigoritolerans]TWJ01657.1 cbb3-type cytochrome oxidase maturation protein [Mucilaginibacter frigoritolerans]
MSIIYFLIGCSVLLALIFLGAFFWAQQSGQNDDLYTPSIRILLDDKESEVDEK